MPKTSAGKNFIRQRWCPRLFKKQQADDQTKQRNQALHFHAVEEFLPHAPLHLLLAFFNFRSRSVIDRIQIRAVGIVEKPPCGQRIRQQQAKSSRPQRRWPNRKLRKMEYGNLLFGGRMIPKQKISKTPLWYTLHSRKKFRIFFKNTREIRNNCRSFA